MAKSRKSFNYKYDWQSCYTCMHYDGPKKDEETGEVPRFGRNNVTCHRELCARTKFTGLDRAIEYLLNQELHYQSEASSFFAEVEETLMTPRLEEGDVVDEWGMDLESRSSWGSPGEDTEIIREALEDLNDEYGSVAVGIEVEGLHFNHMEVEEPRYEPHMTADNRDLWTTIQDHLDSLPLLTGCELIESQGQYGKVFELKFTKGLRPGVERVLNQQNYWLVHALLWTHGTKCKHFSKAPFWRGLKPQHEVAMLKESARAARAIIAARVRKERALRNRGGGGEGVWIRPLMVDLEHDADMAREWGQQAQIRLDEQLDRVIRYLDQEQGDLRTLADHVAEWPGAPTADAAGLYYKVCKAL